MAKTPRFPREIVDVFSESAANGTNGAGSPTNSTESLHSAPHVAHKQLDITRSCFFSLAEMVSCLECDPASALRVITEANRQRPAMPVDSLPIAVNVLGRRACRQQVLSFRFHRAFARNSGRIFFEAYRRRSMYMAAAARRLSIYSGAVEPDRAVCAALLADTGMLYMVQQQPKLYLRAFHDGASTDTLLQLELQHFGYDHQQCGAALVKAAGMPEAVQQAIAGHHQLDAIDNQPLTGMLAAADALADLALENMSTSVSDARHFLNDKFAIDTDQLITMALEIRRDGLLEWDRLEWELDEDVDWSDLLECAKNLKQVEPPMTPNPESVPSIRR